MILAVLIGKDHPDYKKRLNRWTKQLLRNRVQALIHQTRQQCAGKPNAAAVEEALHYFVTNASGMQYGTFRKAGYFIGSGVVEAACKTVVAAMYQQQGRLDSFWKYRLNTKAALNDALHFPA